jgi:hypothetical protein
MKTLSGKAQALSSLLLYRASSGSVDNEYFGSILKQMYRDKIKNIHIDPGALDNSFAEVDLDRLVRRKRFKRKSDEFQRVLQQYVKQTGQSSDETTVTIGDIVTWWTDLTHQNKEEFMVRINTKIAALVAEQSDITVLQNPGNDKTGAAYKFGQDLLLILLSETPADKKAALVNRLKDAIVNAITTPDIVLPEEILTLSCKMIIGDTVPKIEEAFSVNPAAKVSLQKPLFGAVIQTMAKKYGWESGVPDDNDAKLMTELKEKGLFFNERTQSRALKELARRNVLLNIDGALDGTLTNDLAKIILGKRNKQNQTISEYVYEPISPEADTEIKNTIRELLFKRRNEDGKPNRNHQ